MPDITTHLLLPYILAAQAQKHVTHNEALRLLDAIVQLSVLDRDLTAPPASPADGDRYIVASAATGLWAGWDLNVATWVDGVWMRLVPRSGWQAWIADETTFFVWNGSIWKSVGVPQDVSDAIFSLVNDPDPTKRALFSLSGISPATTRTFTLPNTSSELAILAGTQTFSGNKTFSGTLTASGTVTVSAAAATIGNATTAATYGMGTGVTSTGVTKTVNLGTGGAAGSTTVVNIGSATAGISRPRPAPGRVRRSGCGRHDGCSAKIRTGSTEVAKTMFEQNERGITINKALAWTMLVSVTGMIWWGGGTLASLQGAADRLTSALTETREMIMAERASSAQLEARVRTLENSATRQDVRFDALSLAINELKQQARETNALLRELAQRP